jgi:hypothetical protein
MATVAVATIAMAMEQTTVTLAATVAAMTMEQAAVAAVAAVASTCVAATVATMAAVAGNGHAAVAQQGDAEDREKDRDSQNQRAIHSKTPPLSGTGT